MLVIMKAPTVHDSPCIPRVLPETCRREADKASLESQRLLREFETVKASPQRSTRDSTGREGGGEKRKKKK